jgi:hypothetical protein
LLEALPWLVLAAAMRVIAFAGGAIAFPAVIVSFAMLRLWITLLVLTYGLKQSYARG